MVARHLAGAAHGDYFLDSRFARARDDRFNLACVFLSLNMGVTIYKTETFEVSHLELLIAWNFDAREQHFRAVNLMAGSERISPRRVKRWIAVIESEQRLKFFGGIRHKRLQ
jgi:hypothetical protein